jgi:hypothetical protein
MQWNVCCKITNFDASLIFQSFWDSIQNQGLHKKFESGFLLV